MSSDFDPGTAYHTGRPDPAVGKDLQVNFDRATLIVVRRVPGVVAMHIPPSLYCFIRSRRAAFARLLELVMLKSWDDAGA